MFDESDQIFMKITLSSHLPNTSRGMKHHYNNQSFKKIKDRLIEKGQYNSEKTYRNIINKVKETMER